MKLEDIARLSINSLMNRGLRSWLTILGIVIGVAAVVAILSIGAGTQNAISSRLGGLGANVITISPGFSRATGFVFGGGEGRPGEASSSSQNLTIKDTQVVKSVPGVQIVNGIISGRATANYLSESATLSVQGVDPQAWSQITTSQLASGRYLTQGDVNAIVIGYSVANSMFKEQLVSNSQLTIGGMTFRIVGILQRTGGLGGFSSSDSNVFIPIATARTIISDFEPNQFSSIQVKVADGESVDSVSSNIEQSLIMSRHVTNSTKDFTIVSAESVQSTISSIMNTLDLFLGGIASVSLIVGAVGIANTMFMSVMERTRQIGTLKALGTTKFEIMKMFVFESGMIGLIGGLIGIFIGFIASGIISEIGVRTLGLNTGGPGGSGVTVITPELVLFSIGFSVFIGIISGILPARRAANLQPVEALRYD
jgi:putative ABC transport system permease protein